MAKPIFIIGCNRSGTTWLSNILCNNSEIAGIQHQIHHGIHESFFFSHIYGRFGDLHEKNNFIKLVESFSQSDYFLLSELDKDILYKERAQSYFSFFRSLMDRYAESKHARFWLEKTPEHTLFIDELIQNYPDAKFVAIKRDIYGVVSSMLKRIVDENESYNRKKSLIRLVYRYVAYNKYIDFFHTKYKSKICKTTYERLRKSPHQTVQHICDFLGVRFKKQMLQEKYKSDSRFQNSKSKDSFLTRFEKVEIVIIYRVFQLFPFYLYKILRKLKYKPGTKKLPDYFYSIKQMQRSI